MGKEEVPSLQDLSVHARISLIQRVAWVWCFINGNWVESCVDGWLNNIVEPNE